MNIWVFGSGNGNTYSENSRALFEYVSKNQKSIQTVWLTNKKELRNTIRSKGYNAHTFYSFSGIKYAILAESLVISNSFLDISLVSYIFSRRKKIIQLWHGTPLKVLENMKWNPMKRVLINMFLKVIGRECDIVFSATDQNVDAYIRNFNVDKTKIKITGQPRNDFLFSKVQSEKTDVWYVPTFREFDSSYDGFAAYGFNIKVMDEFLGKNNARLNLKLHPVDAGKFNNYAQQFKDLSNIRVVNPDNFYLELSSASVLLTDYSSVYFDFLLLDRPIIFTAFDLKRYKEVRNFYYDYDSVTPGRKAANWNEVMLELKRLFDGKDSWKAQRRVINDRFNKYKDNNSSERAYKEVIGMP